MKTNEKKLNYADILEDLENISKSLYLQSPEVWIDFPDKIANQTIDEMVLFYATKYNYASILKFVYQNQILSFDDVSKNKSFPSIKAHLIAVARESNSTDVYNFLTKEIDPSDNMTNYENKIKYSTHNNHSNSVYYPSFNCPNCNNNVLQSGYKIFEEVAYIFSPENNKCEESSRLINKQVYCCTCNNALDDITVDILENICSINNCTKCGEDLTYVGIDQKIKMKLDKNENKFVPSDNIYICSSCQEPLNKPQIEYFNL